MGLLSYVLFSYQSPYVVISSFYRALEPSLNKLWIEDFIFGKKKKFFSQYLREGFAIYLRYCVFIREIWVPLRNERWRLVTGPIVVVRVMTIGDVHSTVGTLWLTLHHPLQQSPSHRYCRPIQFTRFIFFSPPLDALVIDLRTSLSEIKLHTYELTGTGKPVHPETSIFAKFSFRRILNYVQLFFSTSISNEISGYFEECSRMYKKKRMISTEQLGL